MMTGHKFAANKADITICEINRKLILAVTNRPYQGFDRHFGR